jgi:hypothetical protein
MNLDRAKKKLQEAAFFLRKMNEEEHAEFGSDTEPFDFYLSAFLNAAQTFRWEFRVEQDRRRNKAIKDWVKNWRSSLPSAERFLYKFMNKDRVAEVHREGGSSRSVETEPRIFPGTRLDHSSGAFVHVSAPHGVSLGHFDRPTFIFTIAGVKQKVTQACGEFLVDKI